jgi:hypothetical protein
LPAGDSATINLITPPVSAPIGRRHLADRRAEKYPPASPRWQWQLLMDAFRVVRPLWNGMVLLYYEPSISLHGAKIYGRLSFWLRPTGEPAAPGDLRTKSRIGAVSSDRASSG